MSLHRLLTVCTNPTIPSLFTDRRRQHLLGSLAFRGVVLLIIIINNRICVEVFMATIAHTVVCWVVTPCSLVGKSRHYRGTFLPPWLKCVR
jgi:hypothetical protein